MIPVICAARVPLVASFAALISKLTAKATAPESLMEICSGPLNAVRLKKYWPLVVMPPAGKLPGAVLPKTFVCRLVGLMGPPASVYLITAQPAMESPPVVLSAAGLEQPANPWERSLLTLHR